MASKAGTTHEKPKPPPRSWSATNQRNLIKNYDKSPVNSPPKTPPTLSRNNSTASINSVNSTRSEPAWHSQRHHSEPDLGAGDFNELRQRKESTYSQKSSQTTASHKKDKPWYNSLFSKQKDPVEKEKKKKEQDRIILGSRHAAAVKTKMMMDPEYQKLREGKAHSKDSNGTKTAGITDHSKSSHSKAAEQEARHPHSGPPAVHGTLDIPMLTRIESHDEQDDELDRWQAQRKEWNDATDKSMADIPEIRSRAASRQASPWASPMASREGSPTRGNILASSARPGLGSKRNSWVGGYQKDVTGRWTKRPTPPGGASGERTPSYRGTGTGASTPSSYRRDGSVNPDMLAASLAERLNAAA